MTSAKQPSEYPGPIFRLVVIDAQGCWRYQGRHNANGYGRLNRRGLVHRQVWEIVYGPIPKGLFVCHHCDVRDCVNPEHLFVGTWLDNMQDMVAKARTRHGEAHRKAKLTSSAARFIRENPERLGKRPLAKRFGVSPTAIAQIRSGKTWKEAGGFTPVLVYDRGHIRDEGQP